MERFMLDYDGSWLKKIFHPDGAINKGNRLIEVLSNMAWNG